ncbi:hypothetical protein [Edaphobacter sp.]|uniref:hypothetical protein n=1 Tax=Edaphobacter sp. TaxID=1934404 RepID=UPI002DB6E421|nr:hypothetical protein [Edaphobacter sp.]HEU5340553.1 hypothetical protein [Edaphobacter sp.]
MAANTDWAMSDEFIARARYALLSVDNRAFDNLTEQRHAPIDAVLLWSSVVDRSACK